MSRIPRLAPSYAPSSFNPNSGRIHLPPHATRYERAHEAAHQVQRERQTWAWRAHRRFMWVPYACRVTRIMIEWEAARMAISDLEEHGLCDDGDRREARAETAWYFSSLFISAKTAAKLRAWMIRG